MRTYATRVLALAAAMATCVHALPHPQASGTDSGTGTSTTSEPAETSAGVPTITVSTAVPAPTAPLDETLPSQAPLPPRQAWCPSEIFCAGSLLQTVNVANLYADQKTFVDKPTAFAAPAVLGNYTELLSSAGNSTTSLTVGAVATFVEDNFAGEGLELAAEALPGFVDEPAFLGNVSDGLLRAWAGTVHGFWTQLVRTTNASALCDGVRCESTLIPLNHTFVVPGGRFREQYYWDSFWIVEGLLASQLFDVARDTLQNFMDELETIGFIPNGGRIYYLNRSQPPLFIHMLSAYVHATNDTGILARALPLAELELTWWHTNRTLNVSSPFTNVTYEVARYAVNNTAPRPESYLTDYETANGADIPVPLTEDEKADLYAELASGAETGWDYTVRWFKNPFAGGSNDTDPGLRTLNVRGTIPVCLNSILYKAHLLLAELYSPPFVPASNSTTLSLAASHTSRASQLRTALLDLHWDPARLAFYDFNLTSSTRNTLLSAAHFYPLWAGVLPPELLANETNAQGAFASLSLVLRRYNGTYPSTFVESGLQWDAPNAWPPHQYIALAALQNIPANLSTTPLPTPPSGQSSFALIPADQLGVGEASLPGQPLHAGSNSTDTELNVVGAGAGWNVVNGGNATQGETWARALERMLANRYFASALCSWRATGGSIPGVLPRLSDAELAVTQSQNNTGNMFEKFSNSDIDSAGRGGEYTVQAGFGWTNGVVLWVAQRYGTVLAAPECPPLLPENASAGSASGQNAGGDSGGSSNGALATMRAAVVGRAVSMAAAVSVVGLLMGTVL